MLEAAKIGESKIPELTEQVAELDRAKKDLEVCKECMAVIRLILKSLKYQPSFQLESYCIHTHTEH